MKRRKFLQIFGAAAAVPVLPMAAPGVSSNVVTLAAAHARKYPYVSVIGLSNRVGVTIKEAEGLLVDLSRRGLVGPVNSCATGPISASSKVFRPIVPTMGATRTQKTAGDKRAFQKSPAQQLHTNAATWLRHLHRMCRQQGMVLHPRALEAVA